MHQTGHPFSIEAGSQQGKEAVILTDTHNRTSISILPGHGAMLNSFTLQTPDGPYNIIDNYETAAELEEELATSFKSSKLSPFACRIDQGRYRFSERAFEFDNKFLDGTAIHGLLFNMRFRQITAVSGATGATIGFEYDYKGADKGFPFHYRCQVYYTLSSGNILELATTIINQDEQAMPLVDGWHPYFRLGGKVDDWELFFDAESQLEFSEQLLPTGKLDPFFEFATLRKIEGRQFDNCFLLKKDHKQPACVLRRPGSGLTLKIFPVTGYPYLQLYIPPHRKSIAIENLSGAPDAFNNQMGLITLQPGQSASFVVRYQACC